MPSYAQLVNDELSRADAALAQARHGDGVPPVTVMWFHLGKAAVLALLELSVRAWGQR